MISARLKRLSEIVFSMCFLFMITQGSTSGATTLDSAESPPGQELLNSSPPLESNASEENSTNRANVGVAHPFTDIEDVSGSLPISISPDDLTAMQGVITDFNTGSMVHEQGYLDDIGPNTQNGNAPSSGNTGASNGQTPILDEDVTSNATGGNAPGDQVNNFNGFANSGWFPPDTEMAVGKDYLVENVNSGFVIYNLRGETLQSYTSFSTFFNSAKPSGWAGNMFDPKIVYQPSKQQFVMMALGRDSTNQTSYHFLAISKTSDPTGGWWIYGLGANPSDSDSWLDYSTLSADTFGIYFSGNLFKWAGGYKYSTMRTVNPAVYTGGSASGYIYRNLTWPSGGAAFSLQAAQPHTVNSNGETFFVNTFSSSGNQICLWTLGTGDRFFNGGSAPAFTRVAINTATTYNSIGNNVDQPGTTTDIDGGDARLQNAIYIDRRVFTTLTSDENNDGSNAATITYELNTDNNTKVWEHTLGANGWYYIYPAVTVNGGSVNNVNIGLYMSITNTTSWSASAGFKLYSDRAAGNGGTFTGYKLGEASYVRVFGGRNRWGDYTGADYDWNCPGRSWGAAEYAGTGNTWKTRLAGFMLDGSAGCPLGRPAAPTTISPTGTITNTSPTYTWNAEAEATWYKLYVDDSTGNKISTWYTASDAGCSSGVGTCSVTPPVVLASGSAFWKVKGWNSYYGGGAYSADRTFTVGGIPPTATLISPNGNITDNTPTYTWNAVSTSTWYYLWVNDSTGNKILKWYTAAQAGCSSGSGTCSVTPNTVLATGAGVWWIQTWNSNGTGIWSTGMNFNVQSSGPPPAATLLSPSGATSNNPTYTWNAVPTSTWYYLWVNDATSAQKILKWYTAAQAECSSGTGTCQVTPTTPVTGNGIWWIQTWNPIGIGPWSSGLNFNAP